MKLAISTYSFQRLLQSGSMTQLDCVAETARMGADAIEFVDILPHDGSSRREYAEKLRESCRDHGLEIACYTVAADFINGCGGDLEGEIARIQQEVDIAALLGAPRMRHDAGWNPGPYRFFV